MRIQPKDGRVINTELRSDRLEIECATDRLLIAGEITGYKKAEQALRESEEHFRLLWGESPVAKELYNAAGQLIDANPACLALFGVACLDDVRGFQLFEDPNLTTEVKERLLAGRSVQYEASFDFDKIHENSLYQTEKTGLIQISVRITALHANGTIAGYLVQVQDVTQPRRTEAALERALNEKSMLLDDLQHRIKNSLTLITSLIVLGQNNASGAEAKNALEELYSRVKALAGLYDVLYDSIDANEIWLDQYLRQIAESLAASFLHSEKGIELSIQCEQMLIDARHATPFGLILNELLTNALKYAFPDSKGGLISVVLRHSNPDLVELAVSNDGLLMPEGFDLQRSSGLGLQIVQMLVGQLQGTINLQCNGKTTFLVQVPLRNISRTQE